MFDARLPEMHVDGKMGLQGIEGKHSRWAIPNTIGYLLWVERKMVPGESFPGERQVFRSNKTPPRKAREVWGNCRF